MAEAEGSREDGLNTPVQGRVRALQAPAPILTGVRRTFILIHFAPLSTETWGAHEDIRKHKFSLHDSSQPRADRDIRMRILTEGQQGLVIASYQLLRILYTNIQTPCVPGTSPLVTATQGAGAVSNSVYRSGNCAVLKGPRLHSHMHTASHLPPHPHTHTQCWGWGGTQQARTHLASRGSGSSGSRRGRTRCARRAQRRTPAPPARSARLRNPCPRSRIGNWRGRAGAERVPIPQPTSPPPGHPAKGSPVDQVVTHATVRARLALALIHVQLAVRAGVSRRAHAAVGTHTVQARASVQAGR